MTSGNVTEEFVHEDISYVSQNLQTKDAGQRNQALRLDVRDCAPNSFCGSMKLYTFVIFNLLHF